MFQFQAGNKQRRAAAFVEHKDDWALGRDEPEAGVIQDVVAVEQYNTVQTFGVKVRDQTFAAQAVFVVADFELGYGHRYNLAFSRRCRRL